MRLQIRQVDGTQREADFQEGPVYIGRQAGSDVFLPDIAVSRQHAAMYSSTDGGWVLQDLDSANKTYLNGTAIHKAALKDGDEFMIGGNSIRVSLAGPGEPMPETASESAPTAPVAAAATPAVEMEDTMVHTHHDVTTITRRIDARHVEPVQMPGHRLKDFLYAESQMSEATDLARFHRVLLDLALSQLIASTAWVELRIQPDGSADCRGGREVTSRRIEAADLALPQVLEEAMETGKFLLVPQLPREVAGGKVRSVMAAAILRNRDVHGAIYVENSTGHSHYTREELDYLLFLSALTAAHLQRF